MEITLSEKSGEWQATFTGASHTNNGVTVQETTTVSLSAANAEEKWMQTLTAIFAYAALNEN